MLGLKAIKNRRSPYTMGAFSVDHQLGGVRDEPGERGMDYYFFAS